MWHKDCFCCTKCDKGLEHSDQMLVQTSDGRPVCSSCAHTCTACRMRIKDYALMSGYDSYHRECFRCHDCRKQIIDSNFKRDNRTIFCNDCKQVRHPSRSSDESADYHNFEVDVTIKPTETKSSVESNKSLSIEIMSPQKPPLSPFGGSRDRLVSETPTNMSQAEGGNVPNDGQDSNLASNSADSLLPSAKNRSFSSFTSFESPMKYDDSFFPISPSISPLQKVNKQQQIESPTATFPLSKNTWKNRFHTFHKQSFTPVNDSSSSDSLKPTINEEALDDFAGSASPYKTMSLTDRAEPIVMNGHMRSLHNATSPFRPFSPSYRSSDTHSPRTRSPNVQTHKKTSSQPSDLSSFAQLLSPPQVLSPKPNGGGHKSFRHSHSLSETSQQTLVPSLGSNGEYHLPTNDHSSTPAQSERDSDVEELREQLENLTALTKKLSERLSSSTFDNSKFIRTEDKDTVRSAKLEICEKFFSFADVTDDPTLKDPKHQDLVAAANAYMAMLRESYGTEINNLLERRNELLDDYNNVQKILNESLEASVHLNTKNLELADLNNNLVKQIQHRVPPENQSNLEHTITTSSKNTTSSINPLTAVSSNSGQSSGRPGPLSPNLNVTTRIDIKGKKGSMHLQPRDVNRKVPFKSMHTKSKSADPVVGNEDRTQCDHVFHVNAIFKPSRCYICSESVWGSELRCFHCSISCHSRCLKRLFAESEHEKTMSETVSENSKWMPEMPTRMPPPGPSPTMFGRSLENQLKIEGSVLPQVIAMCVSCVDAHGLEVEGIYRISGSASQVRVLVDEFENGSIRMEHLTSDLFACTSVLKTYLHRLPEPVIPGTQYEELLEAEKIEKEEEKIERVVEVMKTLHPAHLSVFRFLIAHLGRVCKHAEKNLMNSKNVSTVFAPTLMRDKVNRFDLQHATKKSTALQFMLDNVDKILHNL